MGKQVYVAMSGGVDSSVAAALLKDQGYRVTGVFMKFWSPGGEEDSFCLWKREREDALRVAAVLDIPLLTWDFTREYEEKVVKLMLDAYAMGITPNPDVECNREIKFGLFFDRAIKEGADYVATGHYAQIANSKLLIANGRHDNEISDQVESIESNKQSAISHKQYKLLKAKDFNKDQSYFLYTLTQRHLAKTLFPIGGYTKPEVRELAEKHGLPTAEKKDSQGICFIGPIKLREFLKKHIAPRRGDIVLAANSKSLIADNTDHTLIKSNEQLATSNKQIVLGEHDGVFYYTIGQRHGMDIKTGGGPYFVVGKDIEKNILYVGREEDLYSSEAEVADVNWIGGEPELPAKMSVKIRYRSEDVPAEISRIRNQEEGIRDKTVALIPNSLFLIRFSCPVRAVTPGQAAVFYRGNAVLGGGVIVSN